MEISIAYWNRALAISVWADNLLKLLAILKINWLENKQSDKRECVVLM